MKIMIDSDAHARRTFNSCASASPRPGAAGWKNPNILNTRLRPPIGVKRSPAADERLRPTTTFL